MKKQERIHPFLLLTLDVTRQPLEFPPYFPEMAAVIWNHKPNRPFPPPFCFLWSYFITATERKLGRGVCNHSTATG